MNSVILLRRRRVLWGTVMTACLLSGSIFMTSKIPVRAAKGGAGGLATRISSADLGSRSAAVRVAHGSQYNPAASPNPESRIPNPGDGSAAQPRLAEAYGKLPLSFEVNKGQTDSRVKFLSRGSGYSLFLTGNEAVLALRKPGVRSQDSGFRRHKPGEPNLGAAHQGSADLVPHAGSAAFAGMLRSPAPELETNSRTADPRTGSALQGLLQSPASFQFPVSNFQTPAANNEPRTTDALLRMKLVGANPNPKIVGMDELPGKSNYFIGNDPKKWRTNVPNYAKVKYASVYPRVDLVYYGNQGQLEYDFVVSPGADPAAITLAVTPASSRHAAKMAALHVDKSGNLVVGTEGGEVIFHKPVVYQPEESRQSSVVSRQLHSTTDKGQRTKDGGKHYVDGRYVVRNDQSVAFQVASYDPAKPLVIDPVLAYSTYLGGSGYGPGNGIAVDASGNAYVIGIPSSDFPTTPGAFQSTFPGSAAFVTKLNADGSALAYSTYLGGGGREIIGNSIAVDPSGKAYVTGITLSAHFPITPGAFQTSLRGSSNGFVTKLNAAGSALLYSTYLGGSSQDSGTAIAVDSSGSAYVTGFTTSSNFPTTPGAFQTSLLGAADAYVTKLNAKGSALLYSTYLGGTRDGFNDSGSGIAVDASGNAYVTGGTDSSNFPTTAGAFQTTLRGSSNAFVSKLNAAGSALVYSTYLGGSGADAGNSLVIDAQDDAYITGLAGSSDFPTTPGAFQTTYGGNGDVFVTKLNPAGSALVYSTYLGGSGFEGYSVGADIKVDASGNAYVTSSTDSPDFPITPGALQTTLAGIYGNAFLTKLDTSATALLYSTYLGGPGGTTGSGIGVDVSGNAYVTGGGGLDFPITPGAFQTTYGGGFDAIVAKVSFVDAPGIALAPGSLSFSPQAVGTTSAPQTVALLAAGSQPLSISSIVASGDFAQTNTCGSTVPSGTSCTISMTFTPTATGIRTGGVTITDNATGSPQKLPLIGTGGSGGQPVSLTPPSVTFPGFRTVGTTSFLHTVKLTYLGTGELNINAITVTGPASGDFVQGNNCPPTVVSGASCLITVTFRPTAQGVRTASISIADNAPGSPQTVPLTGRGTFFEWSPRSLNMGDQKVGTSSAARTVTLTNAGRAPIALFSIGIAGVNPGDFSETNDCGRSLNAGASCTIQVTFTPAAVGERLGHVAISDSAFGGTHWVGLLGKGT